MNFLPYFILALVSCFLTLYLLDTISSSISGMLPLINSSCPADLLECPTD